MRGAGAVLVLLFMEIGFAGGVIGFVAMARAESVGARAVYGALLLVDLAVLTALSFLLWPAKR